MARDGAQLQGIRRDEGVKPWNRWQRAPHTLDHLRSIGRVTAPLAANFRAVPLWHDGVVVDEPRDHLPPATADVVIIGAGYCGATAAAGLADRGRAVVVVEAGGTGAGASSRNGGMVIPELKLGPAALVRRHRELGRAMIGDVLEAYAYTRDLIALEAIACDWAETGGLLLAHHPAQVAGLAAAAAEWTELGEPARFLTRDELATEVGSDAYAAGFLLERTAAVQPARLHRALLERARGAGADIHHHTPATRIERRGSRFRVHTTRGAIDAGDVLVAANAYVDGVCPPLRRRVLPIGSFIIATEPLPPELARAVMPGGRMCFDTKHLLNYWRLSPDRRMVFGGRASLGHTTVGEARDVLHAQMLRIHPQLAGVMVTHAWGGNVAVTRDRLPHCGRLDGIAYATGCNGTGIALATWFGARAAAWMAREQELPAFAQVPFRPIPFRGARRAWLPAAGAALRSADRFGR
jgi:glycine/D-amino acid oxidase-like deaminating enzyme